MNPFLVEQKVRRVRKTPAKSPSTPKSEKRSLGGFLEKNEPSIKKKVGGSNSVAGDQIAISKEQSLTGEVYVRADGKKGKILTFLSLIDWSSILCVDCICTIANSICPAFIV